MLDPHRHIKEEIRELKRKVKELEEKECNCNKEDEILCVFLGHNDGDYICGLSEELTSENCPNDKCPAITQEPFDLESLKDANIYPRDFYGEDKITLYGPHYRLVKLTEYQKLEKRIKSFKENLDSTSEHLIRVVEKNNDLKEKLGYEANKSYNLNLQQKIKQLREKVKDLELKKFVFPEKTIEWMVDKSLGCNSELHEKLLEAMQLKDFNKMNRWFGYYQRFGECEGYWTLDEIIEKVREEKKLYGSVLK